MASIKAIAAIALTLMVCVPIGLGYAFSSESREYTAWEDVNRVNLTDTITNNVTTVYSDYTGVSNNSKLSGNLDMDYVEVSTNPTSYPQLTTVAHAIPANVWTNTVYDYPWTISVPGSTSYSVNNNSSQTYRSSYPIMLYPDSHGGLTSINPSRALTLYTHEPSGTFADITYGWELPATSATWLNNQNNNNVLFTLDIPAGATIRLNDTLRIWNDGGMVKAATFSNQPPSYPIIDPPGWVELGAYPYIQVLYSYGDATIYGLMQWPGLGQAAVRYSEIVIASGHSPGPFSQVKLQTDNLNTVFRVDSASVVSGQFPSTKDATLDMGALYPGKSYELRLNAIGVYGDTITIAGETYPVELGRISVDGKTVALKGATIRSVLEGNVWTTSLNGKELAETAATPAVVFGGEWSLTVTADILEQTTGSRIKWAPGVFSFDKEDFAACGMLVAGACLVGLGMTGQRSGMKIGVLLLVCGGAALIYLMLI